MSIFKACDIRGVYPDELDEPMAEAIGRAVGSMMAGGQAPGTGECVLGGDLRPSTPALTAAVCRGLLAAGVDVVDIGIVPTPVGFWAKRRLGARGLVVVTASHNPPEYNGMKVAIGDRPLGPEDLQEVGRRAEGENGKGRARGRARARARSVRDDYFAWLGERFAGTGAGRKVVIDAGNGCAAEWAPAAFAAAGYEVVEVFCTPDGSFPDRSPNPSSPAAVAAASGRVREVGADFGVCFDGDADRAVFLDERGEFVPGEEALILFARQVLAGEPGAAVVYDQKSTLVVPREIEAAGGRAVRERSGYAFIKRRLIEEDAALGGEASGHFLFRELGGDDGIYAGLRMGELLVAPGKTMSELRAGIPPYHISDDIRIRCEDAEAVVARLREAFGDLPQDHTDGVRIEFEGGWALCRPSVTEPAVTVRVEGDTPGRMDEIRREVLANVEARPGEA